MDLLATSTGMVAAGCLLLSVVLTAVVALDANRRTRGTRKFHELEADIARLTSDESGLEAEVARLKTDRDSLSGIEAERKEREDELARLQTQIAVARDTVAHEAEIIDRATNLQKQIADKLTELAEADQKLIKTSDDMFAKQSELARVAFELSEKSRLRDNLEPDIVELTSRRDALRHEVVEARAEAEQLARNRQDEETRTIEAKVRRDHLNDEVEHLDRDVAELEEAIEASRAKKGIIAEVAKAEDQLENLREKSAGFDARMAAVQAEVIALTAQRDGLAGAMKSPDGTEGGDDGALGGLTNAPDILVQATRRQPGLDEGAAIAQVKDALRKRGLTFSDRVIDAFHTSLKISSISPLTVLAGISGTGKSELPRQYALAMGLPFLQLAVQPRWDSPQDLFGFYNYMERKYKPTELVRLMVHLDVRNWPKQARSYKDHMALVLLDEMNLARVEYYFSEFLSRLEVRRGSEDESAAEIELDLGLSRSSKVYPVPRMLFVGTMNEDESTQTLSDKVVDRANVLRFPRPTILKPDMGLGADSETNDRFLPFQTWQGWCQPGDNRVAEWLKTLNDAMEQLGRPFGHRMAQAISAYVANYPKNVRDAQAVAMADQLEMRLFPKLRGVDPKADDRVNRAFDEIRKFIEDDIKDPELMSAFETAKEGDLFVWRGVDRS